MTLYGCIRRHGAGDPARTVEEVAELLAAEKCPACPDVGLPRSREFSPWLFCRCCLSLWLPQTNGRFRLQPGARLVELPSEDGARP